MWSSTILVAFLSTALLYIIGFVGANPELEPEYGAQGTEFQSEQGHGTSYNDNYHKNRYGHQYHAMGSQQYNRYLNNANRHGPPYPEERHRERYRDRYEGAADESGHGGWGPPKMKPEKVEVHHHHHSKKSKRPRKSRKSKRKIIIPRLKFVPFGVKLIPFKLRVQKPQIKIRKPSLKLVY